MMITIYKTTIIKEPKLLYGIYAWNFQNHADSIFVEFVTILTKFELLHELSPYEKRNSSIKSLGFGSYEHESTGTTRPNSS
jgi:hypothetical protein